jgi:hypothetical protein
MAISYTATLKNTRMTAVLTAIDAGAGAGTLVIGTSALSGATGVLVTIPLADPSGTVAAGVLTFSGMPKSAVAAAAGTAAKAEIRDSTGAVVASGLTVGTSASDIIINSTAISSGQTVQINSGTITHAA